MVSINHRVNVFGFLSLTEYDERYADSANAGLFDIVAALRWVRDNIAGFGGDPNNVTVFGQSGGGAKVNHLLTMPAAHGLFHRAIAQSPMPLFTKTWSGEQAARTAGAIVEELGLTRASIQNIHAISHEALIEAYLAVAQRDRTHDVRPAADGRAVPTTPFVPVAPELSSSVPLIIGTTTKENGHNNIYPRPDSEALTEQELQARVRAKHGERAEAIIEAFRRLHPTLAAVDLLERIDDQAPREAAIAQAERKAAQRAAPTFLYEFSWQTPAFGGRPGAFHGAELPFVFDSTDRCASMTGGTAEARRLAARISDAWIAFARSGNPSHPRIPEWPLFASDKIPTMVFDDECEVKHAHDSEARRLLHRS